MRAHYLAFLLLSPLLVGAAVTPPAHSDEPAPASLVQPASEGTREPSHIAFTADGSRAIVSEAAEGTVAVIDTAGGKVLQHVPTLGKEPRGVAVTADGTAALVANSFSGSLAFVPLKGGKTETLPLPGMPWDVAISPDGGTAYVSVSQLDQVAVFDLASRKEVARIPTGRHPHALSLTPDGKSLAVSNMSQGSVTFIDTATRQVRGQGPTPAVNLRGVAIFPNGRQAYCVGQRAQNERPTETSIGIWSNQAFLVVPGGGRNGAQNIWLDLIGKDVSDPDSVVLDAAGERAFITCYGGHSLNVSPLRSGDTVTIQGIGACPRGVRLTPDGKEVWVANSLGNDLAVVDTSTLKVTRRIPLGAPSRKDPHLAGRFLFNTAGIVEGGQFSCNSCHPDGHTDGISWKFVHVPDALGREITRNVKSLRGHIADTAPFRWTGHSAGLEDFVREEMAGLLHTPKVEEAQVKEIAEYVRSLDLPPNPFRKPDGSLTEAGTRGKVLFEGKAGCMQCHFGPRSGATRKAFVGTTPNGIVLDVPHLGGVYDSDPYLHDGSALTLEEIWSKRNPQQLHGKAHELNPDEMKELLGYVRQL